MDLLLDPLRQNLEQIRNQTESLRRENLKLEGDIKKIRRIRESLTNFEIDGTLKDQLLRLGVNIPSYNIFDDPDAIKFEETTYVNDDLIPVVEYKILVNKESLHRHRFEWKDVFENIHRCSITPIPTLGSELSYYIGEAISAKFRQYLLSAINTKETPAGE